jgi:hypothetical protein
MPTSGKPNLRTIANQNAFREQVPKVIGEHDREIADIWNKYGFTDKAQGVTDNHYKRMEMIGKSIGPRAALTYAQSGPDGELFQGAQVKDDKDYTMITGHDGSVIRYRKDTGAYEIIKGGDNSVASHIFNKLVPGGEQSTVIQYDKSGNVKETPIGVVVPRWDPERPTASERRAARQREGKLTDIEKQELTGIRSDLRTVNRELLEVRRNAGYGVEAAKNRLPLIEAEYNDLKTREKELLTRDVGTNTPTPAAKPKVNAEALIQEANKAITLGADPVQVKQRLKEQYGVEVK